MKFVCEGTLLSECALIVSKACATKTINPILECIKISAKNDVLTLMAYDGEISIEKKIKAEVLEEGEICVNGKYFTDFMGKISGMNVTISTQDQGLEIRYEESESYLQVLSADEFPSVKNDTGDNYFEIKQSDFKKVVADTVFCCATDDSRPILKGCLLETDKNRMCVTALDGYRMAVSECDILSSTEKIKIVCPARTLSEISRMIDGNEKELKVYTSRNMIFVEVGETTITSRLYTGEFINKDNIFPTTFSTGVKVNRIELIESVERASVLIRGDKNNLILFDIKQGSIRITANSEIGKVSEGVKANIDGKDIKIAMNGKYIIEALKALSEEEVIISLNSNIAPFTIVNKNNKDSAYLILPVRTGA